MDFKQAAVEQALRELFEGCHFSICSLDNIGKILGVNPSQHPDYNAVRAFHCVDYADMKPGVKHELQQRVIAMLMPDQVINYELLSRALTREGNDIIQAEDSALIPAPRKKRNFRLLK
jgi:hypothetical protein